MKTGRGPDRVCTAAEIFEVLWAALSDVIGPTATAALIQRSIKRASETEPGLLDLVIVRDRFTYKYTLPDSWTEAGSASAGTLKGLMDHLWPMLTELTGSVVVRRLEEDPFLRRCDVIPKGVGR